MKETIKRVLCIFLTLCLIYTTIPVNINAATTDQAQEASSVSDQYYPTGLSTGVQNIVKRAKQMVQIQWTPQKDIKGWGSGVTYKAGVTYTGLPYGQPVYADYVPWETSLSGFLDAVNDPNSKMYTSYSEYNKRAPYYSTDCSAFVSWAWGLSSRQTTYGLPNFATKISSSSYANMEVGDCLNSSGHVVLITDIVYDSSGGISAVEVSEATTGSTNYLCHSVWFGKGYSKSMSDFQKKYLDSGYTLYRSKTRDSVTYTHSCAVPLEGDNCSNCQTEHTCNQDTYVYYWASHPHYNCYKCSVCGNVTENRNETRQINTCEQCRPGKAVLNVSSDGACGEDGVVQFSWSATANTTHYNVWIQKKDSDGNWDTIEQNFEIESGFTRSLNEGEYRAQLLSYNSGMWEPDGSDWVHTCAEDVYFSVGHSVDSWSNTWSDCISSGTATGICSNCGESISMEINPKGHNLTSEIIPATCTEYAITRYICTDCEYSFEEYADSVYSEWAEEYPDGIDEAFVESKTQYRYSDYETTSSYETSLGGWTQTGNSWEQNGSGTIQYVSNWPSGFLTSHSLYSTYNNSPKSASETATDKTSINSNNVTGYLYYHWCRGTYTAGPINRQAKNAQQGEFNTFHAFYSTTNPSMLTAAPNNDGSYNHANSSCCKDSYWFFYVPVYTQTYSTYRNLFTYERWTDWSDWSDTAYTESATRKVESRVLYRYITAPSGDHTWDEGCVTTEPTCTTDGMYTCTCISCGEIKTEMITSVGHSYNYAVTKAPTTSVTGTLTRTCSKCSDTTTVTLPKLNTSDYTYQVVKEPTSTETGIGRYTWNNTSYGTFWFEVTLDKLPVEVAKIEIASNPTKTVYQIGESLDTNGLKVKVSYTDGSSKTITDGFSVSGFDSATAGTKTVTVSYSGKSTTFTVTVEEQKTDDTEMTRIVVESVTAASGSTVTVKVKLENNLGFGGMAYDVIYDTDYLELVDYELDLGAGICTDSGKDGYAEKINFQYASTANVTGDGTLVSITFKVKENVESGFASIRVEPEEGSAFRYEGRTEVDVELVPVDGGVEIRDYMKGDITGDGKVNNRDAARLMQYLAGWDVEYVAAALDVNGDGKVNNRDAARLMQYLAGWDVEIY